MSEHRTHTVERHCDVAIIGGSAAGLAAGLQLGRQRRGVLVIDAGEPRNAPAAHVHSYLGHEGVSPRELTAIAREEVRSYGGEVLAGRAVGVTRLDDDRFRIDLVGGHAVIARRVLIATGLVDELPDIHGLAEHWGRDVIHCPFCHGYEVRDRRIVQIITHPMGLHTAKLFRQLSARLTLVLHGGVRTDHPELDTLRAAGVDVVDARAERIVSGVDGRVAAVEVTGGRRIDADAVVVGGRFRVRTDVVASLGLATGAHPTGLGDVVETDPTGATSVPGVYAAGNVTDPGQQILQAAAQGSWAGGMISVSLAGEDIAAAAQRSSRPPFTQTPVLGVPSEGVKPSENGAAGVDGVDGVDGARPSANQAEWDHRYSGDQVWSGNPNGTLVDEISSLETGRALDVGAGEGGDAVWLAEQGWQVTATDISQRALDRIAAVAADRQLTIDCLRADANALEPYEPGRFDLVTAHYASIPRTPDARGVDNLLDAVAPGGTLLVVSHDLEPMRAPIDTDQHSRAFDPDAYVRVDDVVARLAGSSTWHVDVHETRPRPGGATSASHHVDDVVLRARRTRE